MANPGKLPPCASSSDTSDCHLGSVIPPSSDLCMTKLVWRISLEVRTYTFLSDLISNPSSFIIIGVHTSDGFVSGILSPAAHTEI